jgi:integrase/recombinase XerD
VLDQRLHRMLSIILGETRLSPEVAFPAHVDTELRAYCDYASDVCGLAPATLISRQQWIGRFLVHQFPKGSVNVFLLSPKRIRDFFTSRCQDYRPGTAQVVASAIRSYLRFRSLRHTDQLESLLAAVPWAACWRLAALPQYLEADELASLMAGFDRKLPQQHRDYAIVRCLVDLGLRACEVAALRLDDIDWKNGTLTIRTGKSQRSDVLPLPSATGRAIAEYLHKARPATESRAVLVRHRAPLHLPVNASVIRSVVRQAAVRSGLTHRLHSPHRLRHTAATRMLHRGASLNRSPTYCGIEAWIRQQSTPRSMYRAWQRLHNLGREVLHESVKDVGAGRTVSSIPPRHGLRFAGRRIPASRERKQRAGHYPQRMILSSE